RYLREIATGHLREDESEYTAGHDARHSHCGTFRDDISIKPPRLRSKRQSDSELPRARAHGKGQHTGHTDHGYGQRDWGEHTENDGIQTLWTEHFSAGVFEGPGALDRLIRGELANNARDRRDERIRIYARVDEKPAAI